MKIWMLLTGIVVILLFINLPVYAQSVTETDQSNKSNNDEILPDIQMADDFLADDSSANRNTGLGFKYWLNLIFSLAIVVFFIWVLSYIFRYLFSRLPAYRGREDFKILGSLRMTTHASLYIVRFADDIFLLGVTPQSINVVNHISDPESVQAIINSMDETGGVENPHAFSTLLKKRISGEIESGSLKQKHQARKSDQLHFEETVNRLKNLDVDEGED
ncbi:flagellar biosynthetic protein FliO [bacterium]|nr:flagellar biosynthetic protein FliO [bacterium]